MLFIPASCVRFHARKQYKNHFYCTPHRNADMIINHLLPKCQSESITDCRHQKIFYNTLREPFNNDLTLNIQKVAHLCAIRKIYHD